MKYILPVLVFIVPLLPCLGSKIPADERQAIEAELKAPITLNLKNGQSITGNPISVTEDQIQIASAEGAGEIVFTFNHEEVESIEIPGESYKSLAVEWMEAGQTEKALELMDLLFQQRKTLLHLMPPSESNFFVLYIQLILDSPDPARAIGASTRLRPQIENPAALRALDDAILESYQRLELYEEALPRAKTFIAERAPNGESALGYYVLGCEHLRRAEYTDALDLALQPIVFSSLLPTDKLGHCYAVAISAAFEQRERDYAALLFKEMQNRGFVWPTRDSTLKPYLEKIEEHIADHEVD
jgi:tetratricopeptide (TPR) repeat protein